MGTATPTWPLLDSKADTTTSRRSCGKSLRRPPIRGSQSAGTNGGEASFLGEASMPLADVAAGEVCRLRASSSPAFTSSWLWPATSRSSSPFLLSCASTDQPFGGRRGQGKVSGSKPQARSKAKSWPSRSPPPEACSQALKTSTTLRCLRLPAAMASTVCSKALVRTPALSPGPPDRTMVLTADRWHKGRPLRSARARSQTVPECRESVTKSTRVSGWKSRTKSVVTSSSMRKLGLPSGSTKHSCSS
mmetsp:Transcript_111199/g.295522  ORF Transcript_111199/g.295522 Transcript_111199/m.295522 type:complete len:247 (+) Transcript_111199:176-916(+)